MPVILRTGIRAPEQSTPATPASGFRMLYPKSTGWYDLDSAGIERRLGAVPAGGTTGQVLAKASNSDYDTHWVNLPPDGAVWLGG